MTKWMNWGVYAGAILVAGAFVATPVAGQGDEYQDRLDRAVKLEALADEATRDLQTFEEAAELYREAARVRGHSPESVRNRILAAHLDYYLGEESRAVDGLTEAAETAVSWDDVRTAAHTFLDAAWVALEEGRNRQARHLALEADRLSRSPLMAGTDRETIRARIADLDL